MNMLLRPSLSAFALLATWTAATEARAGIEACGNIHIEAQAECEVRGGVSCQAACTPLTVEAQCAADLAFECAGQCDAQVSASCTGSCEAECQTECAVEPGAFDCQGSCFADCAARADASCGTDQDCRASAEATCEAECELSCEARPPEVACESECRASCEGSCRAEANFDCQIECQAPRFDGCVAEVQGGCEADCMAEQGALFCDGDYVDHGGNLESCVAALQAILDAHVEGYADASCEGGRCQASAGVSATCAVAEPGRPERHAAALTFLGLFGLSLGRRRFRR